MPHRVSIDHVQASVRVKLWKALSSCGSSRSSVRLEEHQRGKLYAFVKKVIYPRFVRPYTRERERSNDIHVVITEIRDTISVTVVS